jgi:hypothetical protein
MTGPWGRKGPIVPGHELASIATKVSKYGPWATKWAMVPGHELACIASKGSTTYELSMTRTLGDRWSIVPGHELASIANKVCKYDALSTGLLSGQLSLFVMR